MTDNALTLLAISVMGVPPYSARGLKQTVQAISGQKQQKRTVNGHLRDISDPSFQKYASAITGSDVDPPAIDGVWAGLIVSVDCLFELSYPTGGTAKRTVVPGSSRTEAGFVFYRPRLTMMVTDFNVNKDEWGVVNSWSLSLEEV